MEKTNEYLKTQKVALSDHIGPFWVPSSTSVYPFSKYLEEIFNYNLVCKFLLFAVLLIVKKKIIWMEMEKRHTYRDQF